MTPLPRRPMVARLAVVVSIVLMAGSLAGASFGSRLAPTGVCSGGTVVTIDQMLQTRRPSRISVTRSVSLKANTKYSITLHSWDDHPDREPQSNERWHIQLLSNGKTVYTSGVTPDVPENANTARWNGTATFSGAPDKLVAIHPGGTPSDEDGDSVWAVCAVFKDLGPVPPNTPPEIRLLGKNPLTVPLGGTYDEPGWIATDAEDPNDTLTVNVGGDTVKPLELGTYRVTYTVVDSGNLTDEKTRTVNVVRTNPQPVMKLLGRNPDTVKICTIYRDPGATATDVPDGDISHKITRVNRVNSLKVGSYTVTYQVADSANNTVTKTRNVNVVQDDARDARPVITLIGPERINLAVDILYRDLGATALDGGTVITDDIETSGLPVNTSKPGIHTITYHVEDCAGNEATKARTVIVGDIDPRPEITLIGDNVVEVEQGEPYEDDGATAWDVPDRDITAAIEEHNPVDSETLGTYVVTYNVEDSTAQKADQRTRVVRVVDEPSPVVDLRPEITLIGTNVVEVEQISAYVELGATATDHEDGDLTDDIVTDGPIETAEPGTYTVTYDVADSHEQSADQRTRTVRVIADGQAGDEPAEEGPAEESDGGEEEVPEPDQDVQKRTDLVIALTDNEEAEDAGEVACPLSTGGELEYTVWFANFGTDDITVTARLEIPRDVKPIDFDGGRCEASTCTTEWVVPAGGELVCWTVGVVDESETMQEVVATVTVEGDEIAGLQDQEPTLLGSNRE